MTAERVFILRGGGQVTRAYLPFDADLDALYPNRIFLVETQTGTAWAASDADRQETLLILDERQSGQFRPTEARDKLVTVLAFDSKKGEAGTVAEVMTQVILALIREGVEPDDDEPGTGGTPAAPPTPPRIVMMKQWPGPNVLTVTDKVFKA